MSSASSLNTVQMERAVQRSCLKGRFQLKDSTLNTNNPIQIPCKKWMGFIKSTKKNKWHAKKSGLVYIKHLHQRPWDPSLTAQHMWMQFRCKQQDDAQA